MKKSLIVLGAFAALQLNAQSPTYLMGSYWTGTSEVSAHYNTSSGVTTPLATLTGVGSLVQGVSAYDPVNKVYYDYTDLGNPTQVLTKVDAQTGALLGTISTSYFIKGIEYNSNTGNLVGTYWTGSQEIFCSLNPGTGALNNVASLSSTSFAQGESTFDQANNRYFIKSNLGIEMIDASTGAVLGTYNPQGLNGIEYNNNTGKLIGTYWTGTQEVFASMDLTNGNISIISVLAGVTSIVQGETAFDVAGNRYFNKTDVGLTTINAATGNILSTVTSNLKGFEYIGAINACAITPTLLSAQTVFALRGNNVTLNATAQQGVTYRWQSNPGNFGWMDVPANASYTGGSTGALTINNISLGNHRQPFRLIVSKNSCTDTSGVSVIHILDTCVVENNNNDTLVMILHPSATNNTTQVRIYPNPTTDYLIVEIGDPRSINGYSVRLLNTLGRVIYDEAVSGTEMKIDLKEVIARGVYLIQILDQDDKTIESRRIIIR